jgi:hypothetical protein
MLARTLENTRAFAGVLNFDTFPKYAGKSESLAAASGI